MINSSKGHADYGRTTSLTATAQLPQEETRAKPVRSWPRFRPRLIPTLAAALLVPLFVAAGQWQWNKASVKAERQQQLDTLSAEPARPMPTTLADPQSLNYRTLIARGHYEPQYQILIDNRTYHEQAGYHVITPLHLEGSEIRLLVNRGWIPAPADHRQVPQVATPAGNVDVSGMAVVPSARFFTLGADHPDNSTGWQSVWQNLDMDRYGKAVGFPVQPVVLQLDPESTAGGFAREWRRPDERRQTNLNYAFQWWGFAATTVALWLVLNFRRPSESA